MSETPNGRRAEHIATSVAWTATHRLLTVIGLPLLLAAAGWLVVRVEGIDKDFAEVRGAAAVAMQATADMTRRVQGIETMLAEIASRQRDRVPLFDEMRVTVGDHEQRIRVLERGPGMR